MNLNISPILLPSIKLTYREFLSTQAGGDSFMRFRRALYTESDSLVQVLNSCVLQGLPMVRKDVLRVCDIGGADGTRVRSILRFLHAKFGIRFALDFVEQSTYLMGALSECDISGFTQTQRFEMLFEDATLRGPYDLVLLIHSIFAFENGPTVDKVLSLAAGDSTIVAVSNSQESLLAQLKKVLDSGYQDARFELPDLLRVLDQRGVRYRQIPFTTKWAVPNADLEEHISLLYDWLALGRQDDLGDEKKSEFRDVLQRNAIKAGERLMFSEDEVAVVISGVLDR